MSETFNYTGNYFGANYYEHVYAPTEETTKHLLSAFKHKYEIGNRVRVRKRHRKSKEGVIATTFYTSEGRIGGNRGGGTVKGYGIKVDGRKVLYLCYESEIKSLSPLK